MYTDRDRLSCQIVQVKQYAEGMFVKVVMRRHCSGSQRDFDVSQQSLDRKLYNWFNDTLF